MRLDLELLQTVAIGSFNPAIVTVDWLHERGICKPGSDDPMAYTDWAPGASFMAGGFEWDVDYLQLTVSSSVEDRDCGQMVSLVIGELPHTPVEAIGHNFHYTCQRAQWTGVEPKLGSKSLLELDAEEVRWDGRFHKEDGWVEVTLRVPASVDDFVLLTFNHHHIVEGTTVSDRSASAQRASDHFKNDFEQTRGMLGSLFNS